MAVQRNNEEIAYTLVKYKNTEEIHIFTGKFTPTNCNAKATSICKKLNRNEEEVNYIASCLNEEEVRYKAAEIGRSICGICVSNLYTSYDN